MYNKTLFIDFCFLFDNNKVGIDTIIIMGTRIDEIILAGVYRINDIILLSLENSFFGKKSKIIIEIFKN